MSYSSFYKENAKIVKDMNLSMTTLELMKLRFNYQQNEDENEQVWLNRLLELAPEALKKWRISTAIELIVEQKQIPECVDIVVAKDHWTIAEQMVQNNPKQADETNLEWIDRIIDSF